MLEAFRNDGIEIAGVVAPSADDRLAVAGREAGLPTVIHENPRLVEGSAIPEDTDLIVAAHTHARVSDEALARSRLGGVGYHPSLLPRHRGIAAVEWTILEGDPIAGGSIYHLATAGMPARSRRRTGASSSKARTRANSGSARWRRWASSC